MPLTRIRHQPVQHEPRDQSPSHALSQQHRPGSPDHGRIGLTHRSFVHTPRAPYSRQERRTHAGRARVNGDLRRSVVGLLIDRAASR
ncbi:hypothetical protein B005_0551 [Nocardiopsis alba ATCC BAA-2165]|uniref:Uncharacterized protein n=1 Tax=Nocardiopsis alba (strain ATCC BAA-2165 / BE74) TaxID=1205910 RepID=J7LIY7_NOCAA|nr:hypothetical protein B005_0551 [Nocardiopsis alba ATCC BAA-2165]